MTAQTTAVIAKKTSPLNYLELAQALDSTALIALAALTSGATVRDAADILAEACERGNAVTATTTGLATHVDA
jgi:hypothetical protein